MGWHLTADPEVYAARAGPFLRSRPAEHTVPLTVTEVLRARRPAASGPGAPLLGWWEDRAGVVTGAFLLTPPHPLLLTGMPDEALAELPGVIAESGRPPAAVNAAPAAAGAFAAAWTERTGLRAVPRRRLRLHRLARLVAPDPPPAGR